MRAPAAETGQTYYQGPRTEFGGADVRTTSGGGKRRSYIDPGLHPGAPVTDRKFTRGLHKLNKLGSAAILTTPAGRMKVAGHFEKILGTQPIVDGLTTPTWNTLKSKVDGVEGLPPDITAESLTRSGVKIVRDVLEKTGRDDVTMLLSMRPTGDSVTRAGMLSPDDMRRIYEQQIDWLIDAAGNTPAVLLYETGPDVLESGIVAALAEAAKFPYIVNYRPGPNGLLPDGSSYGAAADAIAGDYLVAAGFNCQTIGSIRRAMDEASKHELASQLLTRMAVPNGPDGFSEDRGRLTAEQADKMRADTISGLRKLWEYHGTEIFGGCCNTTTDELAAWPNAFGDAVASEETVYTRPVERLVWAR